jgi:hypothetical protein
MAPVYASALYAGLATHVDGGRGCLSQTTTATTSNQDELRAPWPCLLPLSPRFSPICHGTARPHLPSSFAVPSPSPLSVLTTPL